MTISELIGKLHEFEEQGDGDLKVVFRDDWFDVVVEKMYIDERVALESGKKTEDYEKVLVLDSDC